MKIFVVFLFLGAFFCEDGYCRNTSHRRDSVNNRIFGGRNATQNEFPYQVLLTIIEGEKSFLCGGSIISNKTIVTAAHCIDRASLVNVKMGVTLASGDGETIAATKFTIHPDFSGFDYDVGIITLDNPVELDGVKKKAIALAEEGTEINPGQEVTVTGWGLTENGKYSDNLMAVEVQVLSNKECNEIYSSSTTRMFCAGVPEGGKDACQGDSGGPAVTVSDKIQVGIVSNGIGCAQKEYPGIYTDVSSVRDWIKQVSGV